jgi:tetratricopeptide (TPR) repeat protein
MARWTPSAIERAVAVLLVLALLAPAARANDSSDSAKEHFQRGRTLHDAGSYAEAVIEYQAAYSLAPRPELLFNIGQCYRLMHNRERAVMYYERYLALVPEGGAADDARGHVAALRAQLPPPQAAPPPAPAPSSPGWSSWRWIGLGGMVVGGGMLGIGVWQGIDAANTSATLEGAHGQFTPELQDLESHQQSAQRNMWIFGGIGAALIVAGAVTWAMSPATEAKRVSVAPMAAPGGGGLVVFGTF